MTTIDDIRRVCEQLDTLVQVSDVPAHESLAHLSAQLLAHARTPLNEVMVDELAAHPLALTLVEMIDAVTSARLSRRCSSLDQMQAVADSMMTEAREVTTKLHQTPIRLERHARINLPESVEQRHAALVGKARVARAIQDAADDCWIDQHEADELIAGLRDSREQMADALIEALLRRK